MIKDDIEYWLDTKQTYEYNLKNGIGHKRSIIQLLEKINGKLDKLVN